MPRGDRRWGGWVALAVAGALLAPAGWMVSDHLEQDDDFCNACHLTPTQPLHEEIRRRFDARPSLNLASAHGRAGNREREDGAFRCIDCHGGTSLVGRARVKALAAKDAFWYLAGRFEEPRGMRFPLWDEDCAKCHPSFDAATAADGAEPFHALAVHNTPDFAARCVDCHAAHETDGDPETYFLAATRIRPQCARCHSEFSEGG